MAEAQVAQLANSGGGKHGKSTVVSVKTGVAVGQKRKAPEKDAGSGNQGKHRDPRPKKSRRSMKKAKP